MNGNTAAHSEFCRDLAPPWLKGGHQVVEDYIGDVFVKYAIAAERPKI